ncbi:MAG: hypothetical protein M9920_00490 [Verrucomicrobiae bacterium]|nr:hypothetical protein [Verrucomicrobiae bacterium]
MNELYLVCLLAVLVCFSSPLSAGELDFPKLSAGESTRIREKLEQYADGKLTLEQATKFSGEDTTLKMISFYLSNSNNMTVKMKLPIARTYALCGLFSQAADLAQLYVNTYTNDWKGWDLLGGAKLMLERNDEAFVAATNVLRLGSDRNITAGAYLALKNDRLDVYESMMLNRMLALKDSKTNSVGDVLDEKDRLDTVTSLVAYSLKAKKGKVFARAIQGVTLKQIKSREDLQTIVEAGCEMFSSKETEDLCKRLNDKKN